MSPDTIIGILIGICCIIIFGIATWRSFVSGDLRDMIEFHKLVRRVNDDLFDGETKILVLNKDGKERPVKIKTINDALNRISFKTKLSKLYLSPDKERGLHLEFSTWDNDEDDFVTLIEKDGNEIIREYVEKTYYAIQKHLGKDKAKSSAGMIPHQRLETAIPIVVGLLVAIGFLLLEKFIISSQIHHIERLAERVLKPLNLKNVPVEFETCVKERTKH